MHFLLTWVRSNSCRCKASSDEYAFNGYSSVGEAATKLPKAVVARGGAFMVCAFPFMTSEASFTLHHWQSMYQREAMWISFSQHSDFGISYAVKISVGGINGLTGLAQGESTKGKQDYLAVGWRDGQLYVYFEEWLFCSDWACMIDGWYVHGNRPNSRLEMTYLCRMVFRPLQELYGVRSM